METRFPRLASIAESGNSVVLTKADPELIKEVQQILRSTGYYNGFIDGIVGDQTTKAFEDYKKDHWLENPTTLGKSTALSLLEGKHPVAAEQTTVSSHSTANLGTKTGTSMTLPTGETVYSNELIVPGIPLSWGEFTKSCTRVPESKEIVAGAIRFAKGFGKIRDKWGQPINLTSGYRTPEVNQAIGGAKFSRHMSGDAGDIYSPSGDIYELLKVVKASDACGIGLGMHKGFVHVDYRPTGRVVFSY